jgi:chemotaxis protein histidine kinase CheA/ActR/RegA family two-component response regulator
MPSPNPNEIDLVELQLQQELRAMFAVDSQQYLEDYLNLVQRLQPSSWTKDVQELYRVIHTIKGSSVTVGAEAILQVSTVLEDLLSDLRHLNPAPPLEDGQLEQILLEAGELLASSLPIEATGAAATKAVQSSVQRIQTLREQVKQRYLPEWNEQRLLHEEFAEQGFGLVVLDLEMALERLPQQGKVSGETIEVAWQTLAQLTEIGKDLDFIGGWATLIDRAQVLLSQPEVALWRSQWLGYLDALKESARQGGKFIEPEFSPSPESIVAAPQTTEIDDADIGAIDTSLLEFDEFNEPLPASEDFASLEAIDTSLLEFEEFGDLDLPSQTPEEVSEPVLGVDDLASLEAIDISLLEFEENNTTSQPLQADELTEWEMVELGETADAFTEFEPTEQTEALDLSIAYELETIAQAEEDWLGLVAAPTLIEAPQPVAPTEVQNILPTKRTNEPISDIQIPVPLNRLDRTAQSLVETLLSARTSQGFYQNLQTQLTQLFALAQESTQYITRLRQLQDDYALLDNLNSSRSAESPTLESYRQGYTIINRLLEASLRLSELGAEAEKTALFTSDSLQSLDRNLLRLRQTVEQSRLVPFKNLTFRARAILRDLTVRFGKPARLVVEGEQVELDAGTSAKLESALLHLIRNAYDHGLETAQERTQSGKPEQGTITLSLKRSGNTYLLDVGDDGRGIDAAAISRAAQAKQLPLISTQTPAELLAVICQPGFSSKTVVSEVSGRGVGMDVVASQIASLGGHLNLIAEMGTGSLFRLQFPVPQLLVSCVLLQAGDRVFAIPSQDITTTTILGNLEATQTRENKSICSWQIQQEETTYLGLDLLEYWQPQTADRALPDTAVCLYIRPSGRSQGLWLLADDLIGQTELLISPLPKPLVAPRGLLGLSLQPNGSLMPVIEAVTIAEYLLESPKGDNELATPQTSATEAVIPSQPAAEEVAHLTRNVLVVDDAALMRRRLEASLSAYGYVVNTCADGQEAWNWLQNHPTPALIITDIEMPNMDGFTLINRAREAGITIPIVVVSSRLAQEWSKEARRLGATDYLTKGFSTSELIDKVKSLLDGSPLSTGVPKNS